jgi:ketosteroid isomerase-like protein
MRIINFLFACFLLFLPLSAHAQNENQTAVDEITRLSNEWMHALQEKDRNRLEQIIHQDFLIMGMADAKPPVNREQWLVNGLDNSDWRDFQYHNIAVSVLGDTAVVRSVLDFNVERRSGLVRKVSTSSPLVDVWVRQDGRWQVIRRYAAPWTVTRWIDRAIGVVAGAAAILILSWLWRWFRRRRRKTSAA